MESRLPINVNLLPLVVTWTFLPVGLYYTSRMFLCIPILYFSSTIMYSTTFFDFVGIYHKDLTYYNVYLYNKSKMRIYDISNQVKERKRKVLGNYLGSKGNCGSG